MGVVHKTNVAYFNNSVHKQLPCCCTYFVVLSIHKGFLGHPFDGDGQLRALKEELPCIRTSRAKQHGKKVVEDVVQQCPR